jgi:hypothetical protein
VAAGEARFGHPPAEFGIGHPQVAGDPVTVTGKPPCSPVPLDPHQAVVIEIVDITAKRVPDLWHQKLSYEMF